MSAKIRYTLSAIEPDSHGTGYHIRAIPNGYAATLNVSFATEAEAAAWLERDSVAWLARLEAPRNAKRPRDPAQLAKLIVDIATAEVGEGRQTTTSLRASKGGAKGGPARARALSAGQRSEIARAAAAARWKKGS